MKVELPDINIQKRIAAVLSSIDAKIEKNEQINNNLQQQAKTIFDAWFKDFEPFGGVLPNGWESATLGNIAEITSGKRPPAKSVVKTQEFSIPLIGAASIMGYTNAVLYDEKILITGRVGTHGVIQRLNHKCWASDNTLVIKSRFYEYVFQVLQTIDYNSMNRGSTQPLITQMDLKKIPLILPTPDILDKFDCLVGGLMEKYENNIRENEQLEALRDTLLPKLMSGEIDVSNIDI
ncbi:MAG: restriction endonuclease subunit S [Clostridia bacterium]|nr:restriction endonuclease subunit S [Clostridia bacterium]